MKFLIYVSILILVLSSCDKTEDYYFKLDKTHEFSIKLTKEDEYKKQVFDTVKTGFDGFLDCQLVDNDFYNKEDIKDIIVSVEGKVNTDFDDYKIPTKIKFTPMQGGENKVTFTVVDYFGLSSSAELNVYSYFNLTPIAVVNIEKVASDGLFIKIDASASYDQDSKYNGKITLYNFVIGTYNLETPFSSIYFELPIEGTYQIKVRAKDNDYEWGDFTKVNYSTN